MSCMFIVCDYMSWNTHYMRIGSSWMEIFRENAAATAEWPFWSLLSSLREQQFAARTVCIYRVRGAQGRSRREDCVNWGVRGAKVGDAARSLRTCSVRGANKASQRVLYCQFCENINFLNWPYLEFRRSDLGAVFGVGKLSKSSFCLWY